MFVEEFKPSDFDLRFHFRSFGTKTVIATFDGHETGFDVAGFETINEPHGLIVGDIGVFGSVNAQGWRGVWRYPVERAGQYMFMPLLFPVSAEE